ncbi:MAG: SUMF1/EgtB/PvdO family nonheme iron enzyme [Rhodopirellula sp.]|nr:SUMF1/EgtB/PvdO family nonheme iron enzyme [Rhodopirellula sp.]
MRVPLDRFVKQVVGSGLMSADEIAPFVAGLPGDKELQDGEQLARELVWHKKLTAYQAAEIYGGRGKSLVLGNYLVLDKLGEGGMGVVLKAEHRRMERHVALKVLSSKVVRSPEALQRFHREVTAAARLTHPNIVMAFDADEAGGTHFLVMEYVEGSDLSTVVKKRGPLTPEQAVDCILQAAAGLEYAHAHGVVHRDIKPANLLLESVQVKSGDESPQSLGRVKVLDMGLARIESAAGQQDELTGTSQIMGTVDYMAPEQARSTKTADARADIYSLGVTLWYLLTGRPMYGGKTTVEKLMAHQMQTIPSLCDASPKVSPALEAVFCRMVAKAPADRYQTITEVIADLQPFAARVAHPAASQETVEDAELAAFLQGLRRSGGSPRTRASLGLTPAATRATSAALAPPAADERTLASSEPQSATDPKTEQSLAGGLLADVGGGQFRRPPGLYWWHDWRKFVAAGAGGILLILLGIWVIVRDKEGKEIARIPVPEGGSVAVETSVEGHEARFPDPPGPKEPDQAPTTAKPLPSLVLPAGSPQPANAPLDTAAARRHQEAWAKHLGMSDREISIDLGGGVTMEMLLIPAGSFTMGSPDSDPYSRSDEKPQHRVTITEPFYLGKYQVTQAQWEAVMEGNLGKYRLPEAEWAFVTDGNPSDSKGAAKPVTHVSWDGCHAFLAQLNERYAGAGLEFCLPAEAQWEYACRAGTATWFSFGNDEKQLGDYAWFQGNSPDMSQPVGLKKPNPWGLYDMHGNLFDWVADWHNGGYYANSPMEDPTGPVSGSRRVQRGGNYSAHSSASRSASRWSESPQLRDQRVGFRVASVRSKARVVAKPLPPWDLSDGSPQPAVAPFDSAAVRRHQEAWAGHLSVPVEFENSIGIKLVLIPPGEFDMGSTEEEVAKLVEAGQAEGAQAWYFGRLPSQTPKHRVRITRPFYLGVYEVTQEEYERVMGNNPSAFSAQGANAEQVLGVDTSRHPVETVYWVSANAFCARLSAISDEQASGRVYRLPTEAEWEYACRAGTTTRWSFGDDASLLKDYAWYSANSGGRTHVVGELQPNGFGLFDMYGNVWEWCADWYHERYYANSPAEDPEGPRTGATRVRRGGEYGSGGHYGAAFRHCAPPLIAERSQGFRIVFVPASAAGTTAEPKPETTSAGAD